MKKKFYTDISDIEMVNGSTRIMGGFVYQLIETSRLHEICKYVFTVSGEIEVSQNYDSYTDKLGQGSGLEKRF